jgi:cytochrome b involved in lipid metabolism
MVKEHLPVDNGPLVQFGLKYAGLLATTPPDRIERAVADEIADLVRRARAALEALGPVAAAPDAREALAALGSEGEFPRESLDTIAARVRANRGPAALADELEAWTGRHRALERRLQWLLNGTPPQQRAQLDPVVDADQLHHIVTSAFRFEARVLEMLAINRVAQSPAIGTFFRSTKEAETNAVMRFFDTYSLYGNVFEWGVDSFRGRSAIERMNQIHGRYYIPNAEIKFVLLQGAFTWLDGADRIGHRPVSELERRGMLSSWVRMGKAMHIQDLSDDYAEMYGWYREVCAATAEHEPYKRTTFEAIVGASLSGQLPTLRNGLFMAAQVAMDDTYRAATGYPEPTKEQKQAVRAVFFAVGSLIEQLPYVPYLRSLMNNPARRAWADPGELGAPERSTYMPPAFQAMANAGFPQWQKPIRTADEAVPMEFPEISWDEVGRKAQEGLIWLVVDGYVYDLTTMRDVHPGGDKILKRWAGRDASRAFHGAKHSGGALVFSLNYRIGKVVGTPPPRRGAEEPDAAATVSAGV